MAIKKILVCTAALFALSGCAYEDEYYNNGYYGREDVYEEATETPLQEQMENRYVEERTEAYPVRRYHHYRQPCDYAHHPRHHHHHNTATHSERSQDKNMPADNTKTNNK